MFLGKTLYSHATSLHPGIQMGTSKFYAEGSPAMDWNLIQGGGGGEEIFLVASCY